jgi:hypothetical protein
VDLSRSVDSLVVELVADLGKSRLNRRIILWSIRWLSWWKFETIRWLNRWLIQVFELGKFLDNLVVDSVVGFVSDPVGCAG